MFPLRFLFIEIRHFTFFPNNGDVAVLWLSYFTLTLSKNKIVSFFVVNCGIYFSSHQFLWIFLTG